MVGGWILSENLHPFMRVVASFVRYDFDDRDWTAIAAELGGKPDASTGRASYSYAGREDLTIELREERGSSVVEFEISGGSESIEARIDGAAEVLRGVISEPE